MEVCLVATLHLKPAALSLEVISTACFAVASRNPWVLGTWSSTPFDSSRQTEPTITTQAAHANPLSAAIVAANDLPVAGQPRNHTAIWFLMRDLCNTGTHGQRRLLQGAEFYSGRLLTTRGRLPARQVPSSFSPPFLRCSPSLSSYPSTRSAERGS